MLECGERLPIIASLADGLGKAPFRVGEKCYDQITYPGYEHLIGEVVVQYMEPEQRFSYTWCPCAKDTTDDTPKIPTFVEFKLQKTVNGALLTVTESGFTKLPSDRCYEAYRINEQGWAEQIKNIQCYVG